MIASIFEKMVRRYKLFCFQRQWRLRNAHNLTGASNIFDITKVSVGQFTYGALNVLMWGKSNESLKIGSFCSIANGVKFILGGNHQHDYISSYPFRRKFMNESIQESYSKGPIIIEDDVWIGLDAVILSGVTIHQGAVIGAKSVVTKNVPPYAFVVGNPAKIMKYRFSDELIEELLKIDYNLLTSQKINALKDLLYQKATVDNVKTFLVQLKTTSKD